MDAVTRTLGTRTTIIIQPGTTLVSGYGSGGRLDARKHSLGCADRYLHVSSSVRYFDTAEGMSILAIGSFVAQVQY